MVETVIEDFADAARLLHDFNREYDEPSPPPEVLADRMAELFGGGDLVVLVARDEPAGEAVGVAVLRIQPSIWSRANEAYLSELYVVPGRRGQGHGRALLAEVLQTARARAATYLLVVTTEEDERAQRAYEAAGFRRTEGEGGPLMLAYERDLEETP